MAIKRVRDKKWIPKPTESISFADWQQIEDRFVQATQFMTPGYQPYEIMKAELKEAEEIVMTNRIHEVKEIRIIGEIQKIFTTDKTEQVNETVGQIKFIRGFLAEMQTWIDYKTSLEGLEADGKIIIHREEEREPVTNVE